MSEITWRCTCGEVELAVEQAGTRAVCYCESCQCFARHLGRDEVLDAQGGSDLMQCTADKVRITKGAAHLAALKVTGKGPIRWYTGCCNTPMCNSGGTRVIPLASIGLWGLEDREVAGAVVARVNRRHARGRVEGDKGSVARLVMAFGGNALVSLVTGRFRNTPFFDRAGNPVVEPHLLSDVERRAALDG